MPQTPHVESHFKGSKTVRDIVIGMSDGLTVPFALAAGLSGAVETTHIIVTAGLAEIAAGSISMGLGGYLAAKSDAEIYRSERAREEREVDETPEVEAAEVGDVLTSFGLEERESKPVVEALRRRRKDWIDFMMRFELGLERPDPRRAFSSAFTIAASYVVGGFIPLASYIALPRAREALMFSVIVTAVALAVFGYVKGHFTGARPLRSAFQTVAIGGVAAAAAYLLARIV